MSFWINLCLQFYNFQTFLSLSLSPSQDTLSFMDAISQAPVVRRKTIVRKDMNATEVSGNSNNSDATHAGAELKSNQNKEIKSESLARNTEDKSFKENASNKTIMNDQDQVNETKPVFDFYTDVFKEKKEKEKALENERKQTSDRSRNTLVETSNLNGLDMIKDENSMTNDDDNDDGNNDAQVNEQVMKTPAGNGNDQALKGILLFGRSKQQFRVRLVLLHHYSS